MGRRLLFLLLAMPFTVAFGFDKEADITDIATFLRGFFGEQNVTVKLAVYVCWEKGARVEFLKNVSTDFSAKIYQIDQPVYVPKQEDESSLVYFLDARCVDYHEVLHQADAKNLFRSPFKWIIWALESDTASLERFYLRLDSQIYIVHQFFEKYMIKTVYKLAQNSEIIAVDVGEWNLTSKKFIKLEAISIYRDRSNLKGLELNMTYVATANETLKHLDDYRFIHIDPLTKANWITVGHLLRMLNIRPLIKWKSTWGYLNPSTNMFSGMLGDLQTGTSEIAGTQCFYTEDRIDYVDFVPASTPTYFKFIFRAPPLSYVTNIFTLPFDAYVWYCTAALIVMIFFVMYVIAIWEWRDPIFRRKVERMSVANTSALRPNVSDVAVLEIGAVTQQGTDTEPKSISGRVL
ncbi:unnamed protein product [Acanthoscelides obtectus]|uniref:Uncharacterized protein n=1 Tax=Acanthoscelides obtectus TaxID=200917 RepID=A0A9P0K789_ACAOB|nr:unnamed protein product [Acanthoscelides obtectus]CAK1626814.1 hypothetical protein AOBTE_LOCUS4094 [Acanthoscelides obtectus]